jgi:hypothetical protein
MEARGARVFGTYCTVVICPFRDTVQTKPRFARLARRTISGKVRMKIATLSGERSGSGRHHRAGGANSDAARARDLKPCIPLTSQSPVR